MKQPCQDMTKTFCIYPCICICTHACNKNSGLFAREDGAQANVAIGIVPAGSGNTVAFDVGITSVEVAAEKIKRGFVRKCDIHAVTENQQQGRTIHSINIVGFGLPADVMGRVNSMRSCCGGAYYNLAAYLALISFKSYKVRLSWTDEKGERHVSIKDRFVMIQGQNTKSMGDKMPFCPDAKMDDGIIDLVTIEHSSRVNLLGVMERAKKGTHTKFKGVSYIKCTEYTLEELTPKGEVVSKSRENAINVDGELGGASPFSVKCKKHALNLVF